MSLDIPAIQKTLAIDGVDGWLLYDFHGSNPDRRQAGGPGRQAHDAPLVLLHPGVRARRRSWCTPSSRSCSTACPARRTTYAGRRQLEQGVAEMLRGSQGRSRWSTRRSARSRICRAWTPARWISSGGSGMRIVSSGDLVGRFEAAWDDAADRDASRGVREAVSHQGPRVRVRRREAVGRRRAHEFEVQQQMVELVRRRGPRRRRAADRGRAGERRQPALRADARAARGRFGPNELLLLDLWGKLDSRARSTPTSRGRGSPASRRPRSPRRSASIVAGRDAAVAQVQIGRRRRPAGARLGSRRATPRRDHGGRLRRAVHPSHRATAWARKSTATACTWTTTKRTTTGGSCRARASRSNRASTRRRSASGRRSTWWSGATSAEVTGPCQQTLVRIATRR